MATVFTLVVYLVVVALSGAAILHIVLADAPQRATPRAPLDRAGPSGGPPPSPEPALAGSAEPALVIGADRRLRSAMLLAVFLIGVGGVLAVVAVVALALAAMALRGALG